MKNQLFKTFVLILCALNIVAQNNKSGVYMTYADYKNNKLSYEIDCKTEKHAVNLHEFLNQSFITIKHKGLKIKLQKDSIYGVLNCNGPLIRFQNKEHFSLAEKGAIWIFYKEVNITEGKVAKLQKQYYFSTTGDGKLIELTVNNIKTAFSANAELHNMIDEQIKNDQDVLAYDTFYKMFRINHIIVSSNNKCVCPMHQDVIGTEGEKCQKCGRNLEKEKK